MTDFKRVEALAAQDIETLKQKGISYGDSWKKRGGTGAYMVGFARKVDRIENICKTYGYDIFAAVRENAGDILDDIHDLRAYLLLIEEEATTVNHEPAGGIVFPRPGSSDLQIAAWLRSVRPTGWEGFVFEGADAKGFLYTCKSCHSKVIAKQDQPPMSVHVCSGVEPGPGYVDQG